MALLSHQARIGLDLLNKGQEASSRFCPSFNMKAVLSPASTSASWTDSRNGKPVTHSSWHNCEVSSAWWHCCYLLSTPTSHLHHTSERASWRTLPLNLMFVYKRAIFIHKAFNSDFLLNYCRRKRFTLFQSILSCLQLHRKWIQTTWFLSCPAPKSSEHKRSPESFNKGLKSAKEPTFHGKTC